MKTLLKLMEEFSILDAEQLPLEDDMGLESNGDAPEFADDGFDFDDADLSVDMPEEGGYELDADGNVVLDAQGRPVKKKATSCACSDTAPLPAGDSIPAEDGFPMGEPEVEEDEDEFDFNV